MVRGVTAALFVLGCVGCFSPIQLDALGFQCSSQSQCDSATSCRHGLCLNAYPDATNTGVPAGTALSPAPVDSSGVLKVTSSITGQDIAGCVEVAASNVTISKSRITCPGLYAVTTDTGVTGTVLEDVEIASSGSGRTWGVVWDHVTVTRANIHGFSSAVSLGDDVTVQRSYIHDLEPGMLTPALGGDSGSNILVVSNWVNTVASGGEGILLSSSGGAVNNVLVEWSYFDGGPYAVQLEDDPGYSPMTNVTLSNNFFGRDATYGPIGVTGATPAGTGNMYDDTGEAIPLP
jgi:hypothetical protein